MDKELKAIIVEGTIGAVAILQMLAGSTITLLAFANVAPSRFIFAVLPSLLVYLCLAQAQRAYRRQYLEQRQQREPPSA